MESGIEIYKYTNSTVRCRVVDVYTEEIRVEIIDGIHIGERYAVDIEDFYKTVNRTE